MIPNVEPLSLEAYRSAVAIRDLTDPGHGPHALQLLVDVAVGALKAAWGVPALLWRTNPIVPIEDNYDRLGYPPEGIARDARYTRYVSDRLLLRTQMSAAIPVALERLGLDDDNPDWLIACPGLPHRTLPAAHPYTSSGLQIDVLHAGKWVEVGECGLAHPRVLGGAGLAAPAHSGLALGMGLDRVLMLRKGLADIRLLRAADPRIASQMLDLEPYRAVSQMPAVTRDLSVMVAEDLSMEELGDRVRGALGERATAIEAIERRSETAYGELPAQAVSRMGALPGQKNLLIRIVLRDLTRSLTQAEANSLRDAMYLALHEGQRAELALK